MKFSLFRQWRFVFADLTYRVCEKSVQDLIDRDVYRYLKLMFTSHPMLPLLAGSISGIMSSSVREALSQKMSHRMEYMWAIRSS